MRFARIAVLALITAAVSCGGPGSGLTGTISGGGNGGGGGNAATASVQVTNFAFSPNLVTIAPGGTVTWTWDSGTTSHNVTFTDGVGNSGDRSSGTLTRTFPTQGTFDYRCTIHPGMTGEVVVQ